MSNLESWKQVWRFKNGIINIEKASPFIPGIGKKRCGSYYCNPINFGVSNKNFKKIVNECGFYTL